jgi:hypothetical protein
MPSNSPPNPVNAILDLTDKMLPATAQTFAGHGATLFTAFAVILICWAGIQIALSGDGFDVSKFSRMLLFISFGYAMAHYYANPIPGIGYSFVDLIVQETKYLSLQLDKASLNNMIAQVGRFTGGDGGASGMPSFLAGPDKFLAYSVTLLAYVGLLIVTSFVLAYGAVAQAVLVLLGPLFVPFFIVPKMDWLFWSWFKAFLAYSFYRVVATAVIHVFATMLLGYLQPMNPAAVLMTFPVPLVFLGVAAFGILKIPQLTAHIFSGGSGGDSGLFQAAVGRMSS